MWASDVTDFLTWLNGLFDDGTAYCLPTPAEMTHPDLQAVITTINRCTPPTSPRSSNNSPWRPACHPVGPKTVSPGLSCRFPVPLGQLFACGVADR
jgi:hypothetical protein